MSYQLNKQLNLDAILKFKLELIVYLTKFLIIEQLFDKFAQTPSQKAIETALSNKTCTLIKGNVGSGLNFRLVAAFHKIDRDLLLVIENAERLSKCG